MSQHTPGPWTNQRSGREAFICGEVVHVASVPLEDERDEANARLIAAAPDLLAALEEMVDQYDPDEGYIKSVVDNARDAISKAKCEL